MAPEKISVIMRSSLVSNTIPANLLMRNIQTAAIQTEISIWYFFIFMSISSIRNSITYLQYIGFRPLTQQ